MADDTIPQPVDTSRGSGGERRRSSRIGQKSTKPCRQTIAPLLLIQTVYLASVAQKRGVMARMELRVATDEAREHVVLELWMDGKPLGHINFDGATVEKHIQDVGDMRAELNETVTPELDPGSRLKAIVGPSWKVE